MPGSPEYCNRKMKDYSEYNRKDNCKMTVFDLDMPVS